MSTINRRDFVKTAAVAMALPALLTRRLSGAEAAAGVTPTTAAEPVIVEIANGRLQGLRENGVATFRGIPYAADTGGRNRFLAPHSVPNWAGVREAVRYGARSPQVVATPAATGGGAAPATPPGAPSEDCCVLNVQTASMDPNARRPVMLYIHGGGFRGGSGEGDGAGLARFGEVVVVTVNHRLNLLGYLPLGLFDRDFADAGNVGQLDLVAALNWVKTNIRAFGGDPGRVTIFGQSGGGSKISTLMVMPGALGLFHRAINMSGASGFGIGAPALREPVMLEFLRILGVERTNVRRLQELPYAQLAAAQATAVANLRVDDNRPVVDGRIIPHSPLSPEGLALAVSIPLISTTVAHEGITYLANPRQVDVTDAEVRARLKAQYKLDDARTTAVIAGFRQDDPNRTPWDVLVTAASEGLIRSPIHRYVDLRCTVPGAINYLGDFNWRTSTVEPVVGVPHTADIAYSMGRPTAAPDAEVSRSHMAAFATFAKTGNPNNPLIPEWRPYDTTRRPTLVIDRPCRVIPDWRGGDRRTSESLPLQATYEITSGPMMKGV